jgi:glycerol kinase
MPPKTPLYVAAIDQGTTSTRCIIFNAAGAPVATSQKEHPQIFPRPAWVEHNVDDIWASVVYCVAQALASASLTPGDIAAVGITNQRETVVVWDPDTGAPLHNALVWQDQRGAPLCEKIAEQHGGSECFKHKTGLPVVPYFRSGVVESESFMRRRRARSCIFAVISSDLICSATKLTWLLDNVPGLRAAAESGRAVAGTIDTFLAWKLTGQHVTGELK